MSHSPELAALLKKLEHPALDTIDLSLSRVETFLGVLGRPQLKLPPVVHVAGTNGKGSTIAFMRAILDAAGYKCHIYTSPHLVHFKERIVVAGEERSEEELMAGLQEIYALSQQQPVTFFEATTALALKWFSETPADIVLLETGMGGRFDATNVVPQPELTLITPISLDHQAFLGDTLAKIAFEKAGIMKHGIPCISAPQKPDALGVLKSVAAEKDASFIVADVPVTGERGLAGEHQRQNAALAVAALQALETFHINNTHISEGLANTQWPARLQRLMGHSYLQHLPDTMQLWLDGGHNPAAAEAIAAWAKNQPQPLQLILGMVKGRNPQEFLLPLQGCAQNIYCVDIPNEPLSQTCGELSAQACALGFHAQAAVDIEAALEHCASQYKGTVLIAGSLYLAGAVLAKSGSD